MNKLKEILDQFELDWGYFKLRCHKYLPNGEKLSAGWITEKDVKKYIQMACIEYAKHVTRIGASDPLWTEFQVCRIAFERRIDQDLQSLNN